ncbi:MAG: HAD-IA family hydrolase [Clostridiales bacterium]|nr:HAD-IA family hydrolase [Clostridiales bacterium]
MSNDRLQGIIEAIIAPDTKVISFDLFDTLVLRPVISERHKFELLNKIFWESTESQISFAKIREQAEAVLRRRIIRKEIEAEDITLNEIYDVISHEFFVPEDIAARLMQEECRIEEKLCHTRKCGKKLYSKALDSGKKVILVSDMYLSKEQILRILSLNGYHHWDEIFVSSDCRFRKTTGNLYHKVIEHMGVDPGEILHIGDNKSSDYEMALKCGLKAVHLPGTWETYSRYGCANHPEMICRDLTDWEKASCEPGMSVFRKMAANKYFDDPFRSYDEKSDYNADPYFVGYAALGPEVLALVKWVADNLERDKAEGIVFLSRDGYLPMEIYKRYRKYHPELPKPEYLYTSRLALLPAMIRNPADLFDLPVDVSYQNPEKLLLLLNFCTREDRKQTLLDKYQRDMKFDRESFRVFIRDFIRLTYDGDKHKKALENISRYFKKAVNKIPGPGTAVFDLGYSGRIVAAMSYVLKDTFPVYYFHGDGSRQFQTEAVSGLKIRTFLDFNPYMEATLREYAYLEPGSSCIGYDENQKPVFDEGMSFGYEENVRKMQQGAIEFVEEYLEFFSDYEQQTAFRFHSAVLPFEAFLRHCSVKDREIYEGVLIDDVLWGGRRDIDLRRLMEARLRKLPVYAK